MKLLRRRPGHGLNLRDKRLRYVAYMHGYLVMRLGDEIHGAEFQRLHDMLRALGRKGTYHHDRYPETLHDVLKRGKAVHARHVHVERYDVGPQLFRLLEREYSVYGRSHYLSILVFLQDNGNELPHEGGIVHHENPYFSAERHINQNSR